MTATYDLSLPTSRDRMRFQLGDTNMALPLEQDETYDANFALYGEPLGTAVMAEALAARYAQEPDAFSDAGTTLSWRERVSTWLALASRLRKAPLATVGMVATGGGGAGSLQGSRGLSSSAEYVREWWTG